VWIGRDSAQDDYAAALVRMTELDAVLGGNTVQHREIERHESPQFLSYFKVTHFHDGVYDPAAKKEHKVRRTAARPNCCPGRPWTHRASVFTPSLPPRSPYLRTACTTSRAPRTSCRGRCRCTSSR